MLSRKYTLRLPRPLEATVQAHLDTTGMLFADLARAALSAYLADTPLAGAGTQADRIADRLSTVEETLGGLTRRLEALEHQPTPGRQRADTGRQGQPPREPTGAGPAQGYDPTRYSLWRLCPRSHEYQGTGQTLRKRHSGTCVACEREQQRERRQARRRAGP